MKLKRGHRIAIAIVIMLYAVTWVFGHPAVHESIDVAQGRWGELKAKSFPILPVCFSAQATTRRNLADAGQSASTSRTGSV